MKILSLAVLGWVLGSTSASTSAEAVEGKQVFERFCVSCHGKDGKGNPEKAKALKVEAELLSLSEAADRRRDDVRTIILSGKKKMPAYEKKLNPEEVEPLLDYLISLVTNCK